MQRFFWLLGCFITLQLSAQEKLQLRGKSTDLYVVYTNEGTESLQDVSNQFGLSVTKISSYNKININTVAKLPKGTEIKIPVNRNILLQHPGQSTGPVYHTVQKGENLFSISQLCYKVPVSKLRTWNQLRNDKLSPGMSLIVGFLLNAKPVRPLIVDIKNEQTATHKVENKVSVKTEEKFETKHDSEGSIQESKNKHSEQIRKEANDPAKEIEKTTLPKTANEKEKKWYSPSPYVPKEGDEGYFAAGYANGIGNKSLNEMKGDAATFKSISGWSDRKFYVLMNDVKPKTLVRITAANHKSICAMVLGPLQETKGADGLLLRISNSAASFLGISEEKFPITITFFE